MLQFGVDAHKALLVAVATDPQGRQLASWQGQNGPQDWQALAAWAQALGSPRIWGIEGSGHYGRGLAQWVLAHAESVYEINPRWVAGQRRQQRQAAKSDLTDALAIARLVGQEGRALPALTREDASTLVVLDSPPREDKRPRGATMLTLTTYGLSDAAFADLEGRWKAWWDARFENAAPHES